MRFVSLFAGIGGIDLGLERAGFQCVGQVEIDPYCQKVLAKHWPDVPRRSDVRDFHGSEFGEFDLLAGGYPCQPFSVAGQRKGGDDERHLWPEVLRIIRNVRPRLVLLENVPGHLSLGFGRVLGDLAESGYDAEWDCIPAAAVGAPHLRDRLFVIAYPHRESNQANRGERADLPASGVGRRNVGGRGPDSSERQEPLRSAGEDSRLLSHPSGVRQLQRWWSECSEDSEAAGYVDFWTNKPAPPRVADGVPHRLDRIRGTGNAVLPQVAELIGRQIKAAL